MSLPPAFPLAWPTGIKRVRAASRKSMTFKAWTIPQARRQVLEEIGRIGKVATCVITTNLPTNLDGSISTTKSDAIADPGVAVHFVREGKPYAIAVDRYLRVSANLHALALVIESMRAITRHGSSSLFDAALGGFAALGSAVELAAPWWTVLGFTAPPTLHDAKNAARQLQVDNHPDRARDEAERVIRTELAMSLSAALRDANAAAERGEIRHA